MWFENPSHTPSPLQQQQQQEKDKLLLLERKQKWLPSVCRLIGQTIRYQSTLSTSQESLVYDLLNAISHMQTLMPSIVPANSNNTNNNKVDEDVNMILQLLLSSLLYLNKSSAFFQTTVSTSATNTNTISSSVSESINSSTDTTIISLQDASSVLQYVLQQLGRIDNNNNFSISNGCFQNNIKLLFVILNKVCRCHTLCRLHYSKTISVTNFTYILYLSIIIYYYSCQKARNWMSLY